nr:inositol monophosphatase family protein [Thiocystis violacea]
MRETAAAEIMPRWQETRATRKADGSLVTETDLATQRRIAAALARDFPGIPVLGEEMSKEEQADILRASERAIWALDPVDGTSNYAGGFPFFAISLALIEGGEPVLGLVLDPVRDECFVAARGQGAFLDEVAIRPSADAERLADCLAMIDLKRLPPSALPALFRGGGFGSQRNLGAVALDWCWIASGRFQLYLHGSQKLWDYAAGRLIATEAGVASRLLGPGGVEVAAALSLEPRLAIAAAHQGLLDAWIDFVGLPYTTEGQGEPSSPSSQPCQPTT